MGEKVFSPRNFIAGIWQEKTPGGDAPHAPWFSLLSSRQASSVGPDPSTTRRPCPYFRIFETDGPWKMVTFPKLTPVFFIITEKKEYACSE
ncbi:MAG: hypothetical protein LBF49_01650 [Puniceicoccales bacterium]|nr:hypothetical protein [Puniceicoccales bacterium]